MRKTRLFDALVLWGTGFGVALGGCDGVDPQEPDASAASAIATGKDMTGGSKDGGQPGHPGHAGPPVPDVRPADLSVGAWPGWAAAPPAVARDAMPSGPDAGIEQVTRPDASAGDRAADQGTP